MGRESSSETDRPVIGVTSIPRVCTTPMADLEHETIPELYLQAVRRAGGVPLLLPVHGTDAAALIGRVDGLVLTGGGDVDPRRYGGNPDGASNVDEDRDGFELQALGVAIGLDLPVLAICRGMQLLNVFLGGTLIEDLETATGSAFHWNLDRWDGFAHEVSILPTSRLANMMGDGASVNSIHHQAIDRIGSELEVVARAKDGVIEAVEMIGRPFVVGVQWHPECLAPNRPHQDLFDTFVREARENSLVNTRHS